MSSLGDIFMRLVFDDKDMQQQATQIGETAGTAVQQSFGSAMKAGLAGTAAKLGTAVLLGAAAIGTKGVLELNDAMAEYGAQTGATTEELKKAAQTTEDLFRTNLGVDSYKQAANVQAALRTQLGLTEDQISKVVGQFVDFAHVNKMDVVGSISTVQRLLAAYNLTVDDAGSVMDRLTLAHQKFGIDVQQSATALGTLGPALKAANLGLDDGIGLLDLFKKAGINAALAPRALIAALRKIKSPEDLRRFIKDIADTKDPLEAAAKATQIFGSRAGPALAKALSGTSGDLKQFGVSAAEAAGASEKAAKTLDSSITKQFELLMRNLKGAAVDAAQFVDPVASLAGAVAHSAPVVKTLGLQLIALAGATELATAAMGGLKGAALALAGPLGIVAAATAIYFFAVDKLTRALAPANTHFEDLVKNMDAGAPTVSRGANQMRNDIGKLAHTLGVSMDDIKSRLTPFIEAGASWAEATNAVEHGLSLIDFQKHRSAVAQYGSIWGQTGGKVAAVAATMSKEVLAALAPLAPSMQAEVKRLLATAQSISGDMVVTLANGEQVVGATTEELAQKLPAAIQAAHDAAVLLMQKTPGDLAAGLRADIGDYQKELDAIVTMTQTSVSDAKERATIEATLASKGITAGLKSNSLKTRLETAAFVDDLVGDYELLGPGALGAGKLVNPKLKEGVDSNIALAKAAGAAVVNAAGDPIVKLPNLGFVAGQNLGSELARGIDWNQPIVRDSAGNLANAVRGQIGILSEPKAPDSPLRGITKWGGNIVMSIVKEMMANLAAARQAGAAVAAALVPQFPGTTLPGLPGMGLPGLGAVAGAGASAVVPTGDTYILNVNGEKPVVKSAQDVLRELKRLGSFG